MKLKTYYLKNSVFFSILLLLNLLSTNLILVIRLPNKKFIIKVAKLQSDILSTRQSLKFTKLYYSVTCLSYSSQTSFYLSTKQNKTKSFFFCLLSCFSIFLHFSTFYFNEKKMTITKNIKEKRKIINDNGLHFS